MPKQRPGAHFVMGARPLPKHLRWGNRKTMQAIYDVALFGQDFVHRSPQSRPSSGLYQEVGRHLWHGVGHGRGKGEWKTYPGRDKFWETHGIPHYTNLLRAHLGCVPSFCFVRGSELCCSPKNIMGRKRSLDTNVPGGLPGGMSCLQYCSVVHDDRDEVAGGPAQFTSCAATISPIHEATGTAFFVPSYGIGISLDDHVEWAFRGDNDHATSEGTLRGIGLPLVLRRSPLAASTLPRLDRAQHG